MKRSLKIFRLWRVSVGFDAELHRYAALPVRQGVLWEFLA